MVGFEYLDCGDSGWIASVVKYMSLPERGGQPWRRSDYKRGTLSSAPPLRIRLPPGTESSRARLQRSQTSVGESNTDGVVLSAMAVMLLCMLAVHKESGG